MPTLELIVVSFDGKLSNRNKFVLTNELICAFMTSDSVRKFLKKKGHPGVRGYLTFAENTTSRNVLKNEVELLGVVISVVHSAVLSNKNSMSES